MNIELQPLCLEHAAHLACQANNSHVGRYMHDSFPTPYTLQDALSFVERASVQEDSLEAVHRAIMANGELTGCVGITFQRDIFRCGAEIGYWLGRDYWGKGIAARAISQMSDYAFANFGQLHRLYAMVIAENRASRSAIRKAGYFEEAVEKNRVFKNNRLHDCARYALLRP